MHVLLILLILAMLFPTTVRALASLVGWVLIMGAIFVGVAFVNFEAERRADCAAHQLDAAWSTANDCGRYLRNAEDGGP
jgi:hypothetical protein